MKNLTPILKSPVVLSLIAGFLLFLIYSSIDDYIDRKNRRVLVSSEQVLLLAESFSRTWNRPPTESEMEAQIENHIKDEVFYREAVALGLDKSDAAVKRRLRQIMELMLDDYATVVPSEDQLRQYLRDNPDKFRRDPIISFRQIYFTEENEAGARTMVNRLRNGETVDLENVGGLALIPNEFVEEDKRGIESVFGTQFTVGLLELETDRWEGPVRSAYGWHLVYVSERIDGEVPDLNEVWDEVEREWAFERRQELKEEQYRRMREKYDVTVLLPESDS